MKKIYTMGFGIALIIIASLATIIPANAGKRLVVIEDHTGAWCPPCAIGYDVAETMEEKYGDDILIIGVHNTSSGRPDNMAIQSYQGPLAQAFGLPGFPSGKINRLQLSNAFFHHPNNWEAIAAPLIGSNATVDVEIEDFQFNRTTGQISGKVKANVLSQINSQLSFNLWVIEDYMSGSGPGWDQANVMAGNPAYQGRRYYNEPNPIPGFEHPAVFRDALGSHYGVNGSFPATAAPGEYEWLFSTNAASYSQNLQNVFVVGVVHNTQTREIVNAVVVGRNRLPVAKAQMDVSGSIYGIAANDDARNAMLTLSNSYDQPLTMNLEIKSNQSNIPMGWDVNLDQTQVVIPANSQVQVGLSFTPNGRGGAAIVTVEATASLPDHREGSATSVLVTLSDATTSAMFSGLNDGIAPLYQGVIASGLANDIAVVPLNPQSIQAFGNFLSTNLELALYTIQDGSIDFSLAQSSTNFNFLKNLVDMGVNTLVVSTADLLNVGNQLGGSGFTPTAAAVDFVKNRLGADYGGYIRLVNNNQLDMSRQAQGMADSPAEGMSFNINGGFNNPNFYFYQNNLASMRIANNVPTAFPILRATGVAQFPDGSNFLAIGNEVNGVRTIYSTLSLHAAGNEMQRNQLIAGLVEWLLGGEQVEQNPEISLSTSSINFGDTEIGKMSQQSFEVTNSGTGPLTITGVAASGDGYNLSLAQSFPATLNPGQKLQPIRVNFNPTEEKNYTGEITITSNDPNNPTSTVSLTGAGKVTGSVGATAEIAGLFSMKAGPNPMMNQTNIAYTIGGDGAKNLKLMLVDSRGNLVTTMVTKQVVSGEYNYEFNADGIAVSGQYFIIADIDGKTTQLPLSIVR